MSQFVFQEKKNKEKEKKESYFEDRFKYLKSEKNSIFRLEKKTVFCNDILYICTQTL